jgi:ABC-type thiamine transport system substrate-binding protein
MKTPKFAISAMIFMFIVTLVGCAPGNGSMPEREVNLIAYDSFVMDEAVKQQFETETGYKLNIMLAGSALEMANKLQLTKDKPVADIVYGVDNFTVQKLADAGVFECLDESCVENTNSSVTSQSSSTNSENAPSDKIGTLSQEPTSSESSDGGKIGTISPTSIKLESVNAKEIARGDVCINADKAYFEKSGQALPTSFEELMKMGDKLVYENPRTSSPGFAFWAGLSKRSDEYTVYFNDSSYSAYPSDIVGSSLGGIVGTITDYPDSFDATMSPLPKDASEIGTWVWSGVTDPTRSWMYYAKTPSGTQTFSFNQLMMDLIHSKAKRVDSWSDAYYTEFSAGEGKGKYPLVVSYASSPAATVNEAGNDTTTTALPWSCVKVTESAGVLANANNPEGARSLLNFLQSSIYQASLPETLYLYPIDETVQLPETWAKFAPLPPNSRGIKIDSYDDEYNKLLDTFEVLSTKQIGIITAEDATQTVKMDWNFQTDCDNETTDSSGIKCNSASSPSPSE